MSRVILLMSRVILPMSRVILPTSRLILPMSRVILPMSRVILPMSRVILPMSRVILLMCSLDNSTGKFTAGKSGVYQISVSAQYGYTKDDHFFSLSLRTSSGRYQDGEEGDIAHQRGASDLPHLRTPLSALRFISLQQGETAWLEYWCTSSDKTDCGIYKLKFCVSLYK